MHNNNINPHITVEELILGTRLGIDSHTDTSCVNKYAYIETTVDGITVDAIPFDETLGKLSNLPIVHDIYAYHHKKISSFRAANRFIRILLQNKLCENSYWLFLY